MGDLIDFSKAKRERIADDVVDKFLGSVFLDVMMDIAEESNCLVKILANTNIKPKELLDVAMMTHDYAELKFAVFALKTQGENLIGLSRALSAKISNNDRTPEQEEKLSDLIRHSTKYYRDNRNPIIDQYIDEFIKKIGKPESN